MKIIDTPPRTRRTLVDVHRNGAVPLSTGKQRQTLYDLQQLWQRLALHLLRSQDLKTPWALGITSAVRGEGKTTSAIGLASALALETGEPVALVESHFRHPTLARDFGLGPGPGVADYLLRRCALQAAIRPTALANLVILPAGGDQKARLQAANLTGRLRRSLAEVLASLRQQFPYIFLDLPSLLGDVDTEEMVRNLEGTLLVVRSGVTPMEKFREATEQLQPTKLLGVIHLGPPSAVPRWLSQLIAE